MQTNRTALPFSRLVGFGEYLTIDRLLSGTEGVTTVLVDPMTDMAHVEYDPARTNPGTLLGVLKRSGYAPVDRSAVQRERR